MHTLIIAMWSTYSTGSWKISCGSEEKHNVDRSRGRVWTEIEWVERSGKLVVGFGEIWEKEEEERKKGGGRIPPTSAFLAALERGTSVVLRSCAQLCCVRTWYERWYEHCCSYQTPSWILNLLLPGWWNGRSTGTTASSHTRHWLSLWTFCCFSSKSGTTARMSARAHTACHLFFCFFCLLCWLSPRLVRPPVRSWMVVPDAVFSSVSLEILFLWEFLWG